MNNPISRHLVAATKAIAVSGLLLGSACGKSDTPAGSGGTAPETAAPQLAEATITIVNKFDKSEFTVTLKKPQAWTQHDFFKDTWVPSAKADPMKVGVAFERTCNGQCSTEKLAGNIAEDKKEDIATVANPNLEMLGVSDEDVAFWKGQAEVLEDTTLANGAILHAFRVTYPEPPAGKARPIPGLKVKCYVLNEGDDHYMLMHGKADAKNESLIWPVLKEVCGSASYSAPTAANP